MRSLEFSFIAVQNGNAGGGSLFFHSLFGVVKLRVCVVMSFGDWVFSL